MRLKLSARRVWLSWSRRERKRFLTHLRPIWDVHRHRLAPSVASRMHAMIAAGELSVEAARIMTRGAFWEVTSVPDIRIQAAQVAAIMAASVG